MYLFDPFGSFHSTALTRIAKQIFNYISSLPLGRRLGECPASFSKTIKRILSLTTCLDLYDVVFAVENIFYVTNNTHRAPSSVHTIFALK